MSEMNSLKMKGLGKCMTLTTTLGCAYRSIDEQT